jgi:hypothetical protein
MDDLTAASVRKILAAGLEQLPPMERDLLHAVYLDEVRAPRRLLRQRYRYALDGQQFDEMHAHALRGLKEWLRRHCQIKGLFDIL